MHLLLWRLVHQAGDNTEWTDIGRWDAGTCPHQLDRGDMNLEVQGLLKCRGMGLILSKDPVGRLTIEDERKEETDRCVIWLKTKE